MGKFNKKKSKGMPAISTASLPDIIFILLFFFMVVTVMRPHDMMVNFTIPQATELVKLENKSWVHFIYVGEPVPKLQKKFGTAPRLQLNDKLSNPDDIPIFVQNERAKVSEREVGLLWTSIKADKEVKMGLITDIKQELRKINQRKVNYSSTPRGEGFDK